MITKTEVKGFLSHFNSLRPTITFTKEQEVDGKLLYLDTLLHRKIEGSLDISIYRKPTHTDRYLNISSRMPCKRGHGLHQVQTIAQGKHIQVEEDNLRGVLERNGYPDAFVKMASKVREPAEELRATVFMCCSRHKQTCETGMQKIPYTQVNKCNLLIVAGGLVYMLYLGLWSPPTP